MFFSRYIKKNPLYARITILLFDAVIILYRFFIRKNTEGNTVIIALHRLGDAVFTIPAVKNIINYHKKNIYLICFTETEPIFRIVINSVNFINLEHSDFHFNDRIAKKKAKKLLKNLNPFTIYDLTGTITSASLLINSSAKDITGINEPYYRSIYTNYSGIRTEPHITDNYIDAIRNVLPISNNTGSTLKNDYEKEYILFHPFTSLKEKEWGLQKYISLAESLVEKYKCCIVAKENHIPNDIILEVRGKNIDLIETKSVTELINVIKKCLLFVGNDSGPTNIANLLGKPTFTIYGPTNPDFHKPVSGLNNYIIKKINCSPRSNEKKCFTQSTTRDCPSFECMNGLSVNEVKKNVFEFLSSLEKNNTEIISEKS